MRRETQNLLLLIVGVAVLRTTLDGTYLRYVKEGLYPFLLVSGVVIVGLAGYAIVRDVVDERSRRRGFGGGHHHGALVLGSSQVHESAWHEPDIGPAVGPVAGAAGVFVHRHGLVASSARGGVTAASSGHEADAGAVSEADPAASAGAVGTGVGSADGVGAAASARGVGTDAAAAHGVGPDAVSAREIGAAASAHRAGAATASARETSTAAASAHRVGVAPASVHRVGATAGSTHRGGAAAASAHGADSAAATSKGAGTSLDHSHEHGRVQWLLLAPVIALLVFTPPALGANGAPTGGSARPAAVSEIPEMREFPPLPDEPAPTLTLIEVMNRANLDSTRSLDGREITLSGFILRAEHGDGLDLARVAISCCVADARYVRLHLTALPQPLPEDTWIEVRGTVVPNSAPTDPDLTPTLTVHDVRLIERPENSYERIR